MCGVGAGAPGSIAIHILPGSRSWVPVSTSGNLSSRTVLMRLWFSMVTSRLRGRSTGRSRNSPNIHHRKQWEAEVERRPDYRITCLFVDRRYRRKGMAEVAVRGALALIAAAGGGLVESYPHDLPPGKKTSASFLYNATRSMYERARVPLRAAEGPGKLRDEQVGSGRLTGCTPRGAHHRRQSPAGTTVIADPNGTPAADWRAGASNMFERRRDRCRTLRDLNHRLTREWGGRGLEPATQGL